MTEPQVWTLIGVFAAAMFGMLTIVSTLFVRVVRAEIGGLRGEFDGHFAGLRGEFHGLRGEFHRLEDKLDNIDRDVQALMRHTFGIDRD